ncbi:hypothetical protein ABIA33_005180 [Streptacidiphilus sp. MAP12-16]|uniref:hypothetical protein n=1 Tax=Streptacidiphilus sp. MAP12-16 TaxID=3156300 RepID=UPI003515CAC0
MGMVVELVLLGAECPQERAFAGSLGAALGAELFGQAVTGALFDAGAGRCRTTVVPPDADANALLTAVKEAVERDSRVLIVYIAGQFTWDVRRRRAVLVTAGSGRDNAHARGLAWEWVVSAMAHGAGAARSDSLLVVDAVLSTEAWAGGTLDAGSVPLWGRILPYAPSRWGRGGGAGEGASSVAGGFARLLAEALQQGLPGLPAVIDPAALHPTLAARDAPGARWLGPPADSRLLLRNRAVLRGALRTGPQGRPRGGVGDGDLGSGELHMPVD